MGNEDENVLKVPETKAKTNKLFQVERVEKLRSHDNLWIQLNQASANNVVP